jgi:hypothetical protein
MDDLPGVTFTITRGGEPGLPDEWLKIESHSDVTGELLTAGGLAGPGEQPAPEQELTE